MSRETSDRFGLLAEPVQETDFLPLSGLAQIAFCPRRFALIQIEGLWRENLATAQGRQLHETAHQPGSETQAGVRLARSLRLRSFELGLTGVADVVEFHPLPQGQGCALPGLDGSWGPVPIEYKRGKPQPDLCYHLQLCGQALCLEEMIGTKINTGYLFHWQTHRRKEVAFDNKLRQKTRETAKAMHEMFNRGVTPPASFEPKCRGCSLIDLCQPRTIAQSKNPARYLARALAQTRGKAS